MGSVTQTIFAQNVGALRRLNALTQAQVGAYVGVSAAMISRYEHLGGSFCMPPGEVIDKLAELFQVHICDLFTSDTAKLKKAEYAGASKSDVLIALNRMLADSGLALVERKDKKAG